MEGEYRAVAHDRFLDHGEFLEYVDDSEGLESGYETGYDHLPELFGEYEEDLVLLFDACGYDAVVGCSVSGVVVVVVGVVCVGGVVATGVVGVVCDHAVGVGAAGLYGRGGGSVVGIHVAATSEAYVVPEERYQRVDGVFPPDRVGYHEAPSHGIDSSLYVGTVEELVEEQIQWGQCGYRFSRELGEGACDC